MPRLKPPRHQQEQDDEPVIEQYIEPDGPIEIELAADDAGSADVTLTPPADKAELKTDASDDPLKKALDAQKRAEEMASAANARAADAQRREQERVTELEKERGDREEAQYNSVLTAIAAEQSALDKAEADYAAYAQAGDWANAGKAQRVMATASARIDRLEDGKQTFEQRRETSKVEKPPVRTEAPLDFEQKIAKLPDTAKGWLRNHPEFINDTALNEKINAAHGYLTTIKGKTPFSPDYFEALDEQFGFKKPPEVLPETQPQRRSAPVSAPVSREVHNPSGQRVSESITLTQEQRRIARTSFTATDMTDRQKEHLYAQNLKKLQTMRANGSYPTREQG